MKYHTIQPDGSRYKEAPDISGAASWFAYKFCRIFFARQRDFVTDGKKSKFTPKSLKGNSDQNTRIMRTAALESNNSQTQTNVTFNAINNETTPAYNEIDHSPVGSVPASYLGPTTDYRATDGLLSAAQNSFQNAGVFDQAILQTITTTDPSVEASLQPVEEDAVQIYSVGQDQIIAVPDTQILVEGQVPAEDEEPLDDETMMETMNYL
jgi:hypothetical protein